MYAYAEGLGEIVKTYVFDIFYVDVHAVCSVYQSVRVCVYVCMYVLYVQSSGYSYTNTTYMDSRIHVHVKLHLTFIHTLAVQSGGWYPELHYTHPLMTSTESSASWACCRFAFQTA
jgi:hypothetical protein